MADTAPTSEEAGVVAIPAVSTTSVGDQGDGHQPSLLSEAEDAISHLQVAEEASHESMELEVGGEGDLSGQVSSQTLEPTEEASLSSSSDSCKGSDKGDNATSSESEESDAEGADHQPRDGRARQ